jgi:phosphohistidine phosphatase
MRREADAFARLAVRPDVIVTSPLVRARETAEIVAARLGLSGRLREDERLRPGFGVERLREIVAELGRVEVAMLVGHEPDFSATIGALTGGVGVICKKGCLARVDLDAESWTAELVWLLQPRVLMVATKEETSGGD